MRRRVDIPVEMHRRDIGDAAIEAFFSGNGAGDELPPSLAAIADELRGLAVGPVPDPTPQLAALLADGFSAEEGDLPAAAVLVAPGAMPGAAAPGKGTRRSRLAGFVAGLSAAAKAGLGAGVAMASVTAVGAAGALPGPVQNVVATGLEAVTPFDLPHSDDGADDATEPANVGERVSTDAEDGGVDGQVVSEDAKRNGESNRADAAGGAGRPEDPGSAGADHGSAKPAADHGPAKPAADHAATSSPDPRPEGAGRTVPPSTGPRDDGRKSDDPVVVGGGADTGAGSTGDLPAPLPTDRGHPRR